MGGNWTPGPWVWMGNGPHDIYLATTHSGRRYVMGFRRMGLQGAQPVFQVNGRMVPARDLLQFDVGARDVVGLNAAKSDESVYRYDIRGIAQADARVIAAAPTLAESAIEIDRLMLVIESAVRRADQGNHAAVLAALKSNRAALSLARGEQQT